VLVGWALRDDDVPPDLTRRASGPAGR